VYFRRRKEKVKKEFKIERKPLKIPKHLKSTKKK